MLPSAFVYILTNAHHTVLYVRMTNNLRSRVWEHQQKPDPRGFTARYNVYKPVYYEPFDLITDAIKCEHYIKGKTLK